MDVSCCICGISPSSPTKDEIDDHRAKKVIIQVRLRRYSEYDGSKLLMIATDWLPSFCWNSSSEQILGTTSHPLSLISHRGPHQGPGWCHPNPLAWPWSLVYMAGKQHGILCHERQKTCMPARRYTWSNRIPSTYRKANIKKSYGLVAIKTPADE